MIKSYFTIAFRNLVKNRFASLLNIGGLAVGMSVAILIGLWIYDELSFNNGFKNHDRIAQVMQNVSSNGEIGSGTTIPFLMGEELRKEYGSDFKYISMASWNQEHILALAEKKLTRNGSFFEPSALDMLNVELLKGSRSALNDPKSILLSQSSARAFFGDEDPMGKMMKMDNNLDVKITGVYPDFPTNSTFSEVGFISPWELFVTSQGLKSMTDPWRCNCFLGYTQLADHADIGKVSEKIKDIKLSKINKSELTGHPQVFLYPMNRWHLYEEFKNGKNSGGRIQYVWLFGFIGIFVLLLACINFMNLSTARSEKRAREVGIRKSVGSLRSQLILQFFSESVLVSMLAFIISVGVVQFSLPFFNEISGKKMSVLWTSPAFWLLGIGFSIVTGLIAGSYPALYLSSFNPVKVLKGTFRVGRLASIPRKVLVVLQFSISIILIIGTTIVFREIQFAKDRPIGYNRNGLLALPILTGDIHNHFDAIKTELKNNGAIVSMAEAGSPTTSVWSTNAGFNWKGKDPNQAVEFPNTDVSYDYGRTVGWQFLEGRDFSREFLTDSSAFVMNEKAVQFTGLKNPVGQIITWDGVPFRIIGVIKDMVVESPYATVRPSLFHLSNSAGGVLIAKLNPSGGTQESIKKMESVFKKYNSSQPFDYMFVDEEYAKKFGNEQRIGTLAGIFAILAIFISCLGLFGMASFMAEQRTKEIGVRKILGASVFSLWQLLSKDFLLLVVISLIIATPIAYYYMHNWLQNYEYHADMAWWIFAGAGAGAILITMLTVSYQSIRAALTNPTKSLRSE
jgi:putative ABC transport system permease protein